MAAYSARGELIAASEKDVDCLSTLTKKLASDNKLQDTVSELSKRQLDDLWDEVLRMCMVAILDRGEDDQELKESADVLECITSLASVTVACLATAQEGEPCPEVPASLQETVIIIHGILPTLPADLAKLKDQMCLVFEAWWTSGFPCRNEVMGNTLVYLLTRSTEPKATQADIMRVWKLHSVLSSLDIDGQGAVKLVPLLQRCLYHHHYISTPQGIKFLVHLFTLSPSLTDKLHTSIKNHLLDTPKSWHTKYGEVYFRAWQKSTDDLKQRLEQGCIQDLMFKAVHLPRGGPHCLATILFRVLTYFHKQKNQRGVEAMLTHLYEPILWRSLMVANSDVRVNAAHIMFDVFPLQNLAMNAEESDKLLQRQFDMMHQLLTDSGAEVRLVAVRGVGRLLGLYWELIPTQVIQCLITTLVQELAYDITSPYVREAVIKVMSCLCDNHLCVPMLKKVLPELKNFIHDTAECVRVAMLDLLLKIKGLRAIKFWVVVPVEHILARLEVDTPSVAKRIMKLVGTSFVPLDQPPAEQIDRCLTLIKGNPGAARQFFVHLPQHLAVQDCTKLIVLLCRYALETVKQHQNDGSATANDSTPQCGATSSKGKKSRPSTRRSGSPKGDSEKSTVEEGDQEEEDEVPLSVVLTGVIEAMYLMYQGVYEKMDSKEEKDSLAKKLCVTVRELMGYSQDARLDSALIALAGNLPSRGLPLFSQNLVNRLKKMGGSPGVNTSLGGSVKTSGATVILKALVLQGQAEPVFEMIRESLKKAVTEEEEEVGDKKKKKKRAVGFAIEETNIPSLTAIAWLLDMLSHVEGQPMLLKRHRESLVGLAGDLQLILSCLRKLLRSEVDTPPASCTDVLIHVFTAYLRLLLFLKANPSSPHSDHSNDETAVIKSLHGALEWTHDVLIGSLKSSMGNVIRQKVCQRLLEAGLKACHCLMLVGCPDNQLMDQMITLFMALTKAECPYIPTVVSNVLACLYQVTQLRHHQRNEGDNSNSELSSQQHATQGMSSVVSQCVTQCVYQVLESACEHFVINSDEDISREDKARAFSQESPAFNSLFQELTGPGRGLEGVQALHGRVLACMLKELAHCSKDDSLSEDSNPPPLCSALLSAVKRRHGNKSMFVNVMDQKLSLEGDKDIHHIHAYVYLVAVFKTYQGVDIAKSTERGLHTLLGEWRGEDAVLRNVHKSLMDQVTVWISTDGEGQAGSLFD